MNRIRTYLKKIIPVAVAVLLLLPRLTTAAQLTINLIAVNGTEQAKVVPVKHFLPKELAPEDILETGALKLDYDVDKAGYFVYGDVQFKPKESKTFKIKVNDVWKITEEEIGLLRQQLDENLSLAEDGQDQDALSFAKQKINKQLDYVLAQQNNYSDNIERRIEEYRAQKVVLEDIKKKIFEPEYIHQEAKGIAELEEAKNVKFLIEVTNPSKTKDKTVEQKHYLPEEIRAENVIDAKGFDIRYDNEKEKAYLAKTETFKPGEVKKYEILIKDIWQIPLPMVNSLETRAAKAHEEIKGSTYELTANYLFDRIKEKLDLIRASQAKEKTIKEHIGIFRVNKKRYDEALEDVEKLEKMLAMVRAKRLEELEKGKVKNVLQRLQALRGLAALSQALFKKKISRTMTWKIIIGTLIFIAFFTTWHFITWTRRSKIMGEEQGLKPGEDMKVVPKPGEGEEKEEEEEQ